MSKVRPGMVPYLAYNDVRAAIDFLERAFGFERSAFIEGDDGQVMHAEMQFAGGAIMLAQGADEQRLKSHWDKPAGRGIYVVVDDVDAHFKQSSKAGATVVYKPEDTEFKTRRYRVMDPEGYEWSFGDYAPKVK